MPQLEVGATTWCNVEFEPSYALGPCPNMDEQTQLSGLWAEMLKSLEATRKRVSARIPPDAKAELGQFLTPSAVAHFMAAMFRPDHDVIRILDPGAGIGTLTAALVAALAARSRPQIEIRATLYEVDPDLATTLRSTMAKCQSLCAESGITFQYEISTRDFIEQTASALVSPLTQAVAADYNCVILNPPYRKLHSDTPTRRILSDAGIEVNNLYSAFLSLAARLLADNGELVAITPRSFCNGPYFKAFRYDFFSRMSLRAIHVYESRSRAFRDDDVLQENIIFYAVKSRLQPSEVLISSSLGPHDPAPRTRVVPFREVFHAGDQELVVHIVTDDASQSAATLVTKLRCGLHDLGLTVSTGRVVDFRAIPFLRRAPDDNTVPLIYPFNLEDGLVIWPKGHLKKPTAIVASESTKDLLVPSEYYVLVKRFSAKEERRRIVAAIYDPLSIPHAYVGFENHLNYFHVKGRGLPVALARGLAAYLNSTFADSYFRNFNGHTQVNAQDLRRLKYPTLGQLLELGERVADNINDESLIDRSLMEVLGCTESVELK